MEMHLWKLWAARTPAEHRALYWALVNQGLSGETAHCRILDKNSWVWRS